MSEQFHDASSWTGESAPRDAQPVHAAPLPAPLTLSEDGARDSTLWTGDLGTGVRTSSRGESSRMRLIVAGSVFLGVFAALGLNSFRRIEHSAPAVVSWVRFLPAHADKHGWIGDAWKIHISLPHDDTDLVLHQAPPDWMGLHRPLRVTYVVGRLYHDLILENVVPVP